MENVIVDPSSDPFWMDGRCYLAVENYPTSQVEMLISKRETCKAEKWCKPVHFVVCCSHHHLILFCLI